MSVATQGDPDGVWTYEDPEASLDLLAIRSLHMRSSEDDVSLGLVPPFPNEKDLEAFVRDFAIDDAISDCFAGLPPSCNGGPGTSSFMPLASQPEKKLVSPGTKVGPSSHWKRGSPAAASRPPLTSDPPAVANDSAGPKSSRGFLASLLARGVKGFKAEGRNKKLPPHPPPAQLPSNVSGKGPPSPQNSLAEDGNDSALHCDDPTASRDPLLDNFSVVGESECLFEDVSLAHRDGTVSDLHRGIGRSEQGFCGDEREAQSPEILYESNNSVGYQAGFRDTTAGKRSNVGAAGKPLAESGSVISRQHVAAEDNAIRKQYASLNNEADVSVGGATAGKRQTQGVSAGKQFHQTQNAPQKHDFQNKEPNKETSATSGHTSITRSATNEKNNKPAAGAETQQSELLEEQQTEVRKTKTRDSPPGARRGPWEGLIQGIDSFIDFERDPSLEIPLDSRLTSQFDFERDSSLELESLDSNLASQFEFDVQEGGTAPDPPPSPQADSERAPGVCLPLGSNHPLEPDDRNVNEPSGKEDKKHEDTDRLVYARLKAEGLPPSGKAFAASKKAFSSPKIYAAREKPFKVQTGSLSESVDKDSASERSLASSDMTSKTQGSGLISSDLVTESTQTEFFYTGTQGKGRAASYIQIAMTQLSNLSSYSACSEVVSRTMSHLQNALLELSGEAHPSDVFDPPAPHEQVTTNSLAAFFGSETDSSDTRVSPFPFHESHVLYASNYVTKDSQVLTDSSSGSSNPADSRSSFVDGTNQNERTTNRKSRGSVEFTSAETLPTTENVVADPVGLQERQRFEAAAARTVEKRSVVVSSLPSPNAKNPADDDRGPRLSRDATPTRPYSLSTSTSSTTPITTTTTATTSPTATDLRRPRDLDPARTTSSRTATSRDTDSTDSTSTVTSVPNTVKAAARHKQREETTMTTITTTTKKKNPNKQKESRVFPLPGGEESQLQSELLRPPAGYADYGELLAEAEPVIEDETPTDPAAAAADTAVLNPFSWGGASKGHRHEHRCSRSSCSSSNSRRRKRETVETASHSSGHRKRRENSCSVSSIDTVGYKANNYNNSDLSRGAPPYAGAMVDVQRGGGGGEGDCESFLTSSWSEMTSVSSVCDVITSADESSYYSGDDDEENDDEEEEEDEATPVVRLGLQDEDQDESELRHHRLQRHLEAVLRQASAPSVTIETVVAATGERLNSQERHFNHINQGALYPFSSPSPCASAYKATPSDGKAPPFSASQGGDRAGPSHGSEKTASTRSSRAFASSITGKKGGAAPRLFSPERQVSQVEARQMTSDQFRESYDRSSDIAKIKRSQLDGDVPWDLLQFSDTDDDAASDHAWYDVTSEEESAAHAYSTDTDSSAAASDW